MAFSRLFGGGNSPADKAGKQLDNMPPFLMMLMQKFGQRGDQAAGPLMEQYQKMASDPSSVLSGIGKGYTESPGYQWNKDQALSSASNAAAAGGMLGSPQHQQTAMDTASGLASRDYNDYMRNAMGMYSGGLGGLEGFNKQGFDATNDFARMMKDYFEGKTNMEYEGQAAKNMKGSDMLNKLFGIGSMAIGGAAGGPAGAAMGSKFADLFK